MFHFAGNSDRSVRIAGVTVPISELLNNDKDVYSTFYTNIFTDENITNTRKKRKRLITHRSTNRSTSEIIQ